MQTYKSESKEHYDTSTKLTNAGLFCTIGLQRVHLWWMITFVKFHISCKITEQVMYVCISVLGSNLNSLQFVDLFWNSANTVEYDPCFCGHPLIYVSVVFVYGVVKLSCVWPVHGAFSSTTILHVLHVQLKKDPPRTFAISEELCHDRREDKGGRSVIHSHIFITAKWNSHLKDFHAKGTEASNSFEK